MRSLLLTLFFCTSLLGQVRTGVDQFFSRGYDRPYRGKRIGLITNHTGVDQKFASTIDHFSQKLELVALFAPEHGIDGSDHAEKKVAHSKRGDIPIYTLYGETRRPTEEMLKGIDVLVFDIQDVGNRCYTYISTLFYAMEEAAKRKIKVVVLDRPNPINGITVDGPMLEEKYRSFVGYINVPLCHGMTVGELAKFFNGEYKVGCDLEVIPMAGWKREMSFAETGLPWVPTSPQIPDVETPTYYPSTALIGEAIGGISIGVGYTLPFKVVGAPWIDSTRFANALNAQALPGIHFQPYTFRPFFGRFKGKDCLGVRLVVTDPKLFRPVTTQFMIIGLLKSLYPKEFAAAQKPQGWRRDLFHKFAGSDEILRIIEEEPLIAWKLIAHGQEERKAFLSKRQKYLIY